MYITGDEKSCSTPEAGVIVALSEITIVGANVKFSNPSGIIKLILFPSIFPSTFASPILTTKLWIAASEL